MAASEGWVTLYFSGLMLLFTQCRILSLDGISQKVLMDNLRAMEADGLITRTVYAEVPPRVEYSLSELGETMRPILDAMEEWGNSYKSAIHS